MKLLILFVSLFFGFKSKANFEDSTKKGIATYYHNRFEGRRTATGEVFRQSGMTGASNNYPLNTKIKVTNLSNDTFVIVRINDRMAKRMSRKGRVVDLTSSAAKVLGFFGNGMTKVKVEKILL